MNDLLKAADRSFCTFRLAGRLYGIEVLHLREISPCFPITRVPQAPPSVRGLANLRSRIYLVLDLRPMLGMPAVHCTPVSRLMILKPEFGQDLCILVEEGGDIAHVRADQIDAGARDIDAVTEASLITGVCKLDSELMMIIDPNRFAEATTWRPNTASDKATPRIADLANPPETLS